MLSIRDYGFVDHLGNGQGSSCRCVVWRWLTGCGPKLVVRKLWMAAMDRVAHVMGLGWSCVRFSGIT